MLFQEALQTGTLANLAPWAVFLPIIGLLINLIVGQRLGQQGSGVVASLASGLSFVLSVVLAVFLAAQPGVYRVLVAEWIHIGDFGVDWIFRVDTLSVTMMLVVTGVGTLIHVYSIGYMSRDVVHNGDPGRFRRFFVYMNLFIAAMLILVGADNFLMMFVGWEGVGLCSYLLIGFWFEKGKDGIGNARAAKKAFVVNRIGDFGLLIAMFLIYWNFGSLQFDAIFEKAPEIAVAVPGLMLAITLFMLLGVTGKSAQLPLYLWLPDAMAGPTPVSALIHAATMVTAGVYLIARSHALYVLEPNAQSIVAWVGGATALFAATIAVAQSDIKRVLAYSTISQLGFMVAAVGMGAFVAGMFHLVTHAFFKALLFLSAGSVILGMEHSEESAQHGSRRSRVLMGRRGGVQIFDTHETLAEMPASHSVDPQDMRNMGGLRSRLPTTFWVYLLGALALSGIFPLSGFFSKDEILAAALRLQPGVFILLLIAAFFTAFYMGRQILLVFGGQPRTAEASHAGENPAIITIPLIVLAFLAVVGGALNLPGVLTLEHWLEHTIEAVQPGEFALLLAGAALLIAVLGLWLAWSVYGGQHALSAGEPDPLRRKIGGLFTAMERRWGLDQALEFLASGIYRLLANFLGRPVDLGFINALGDGLAEGTRRVSALLRRFQTGFVRSYALIFLFGAVAILTYFVLR